MATTRLTPAERPHYGEFVSVAGTNPRSVPLLEPALGTLNQRLTILVQRHGGRTAPVRASAAEQAEYTAWLAENDPSADNPYA